MVIFEVRTTRRISAFYTKILSDGLDALAPLQSPLHCFYCLRPIVVEFKIFQNALGFGLARLKV